MYIQQNQPLKVLQGEEFNDAIAQLEWELCDYRREGYFAGEGGKKIYYEYFTVEQPRGSIVVIHGLSEFTEKYYELTAYLLGQGYNVFLYDQRGHGFSHRDTCRPELIHINSFDQLVTDLDIYIETKVRPAGDRPIYLYGHSLGASVGLLYLTQHGQKIKKAVLTSPLLVPKLKGLPCWPFRVGIAIHRFFAGKKAKFLLSGEYQVGMPYKHIPGDSAYRVRHCLAYRDKEPRYRSTPMTLGCAWEILNLRRRLLSREVTEGIRVPVYMLCAENDTMVKTRYQGKFAKRCAACTHEILPGANHALHTNSSELLTEALEKILHFLQED